MSKVVGAQLTKHEQLLQYIKDLRAGQKISVRQMAKQMGVSEGTAYRAIKEAEHIGLVSTKERIGTIRIEKVQREHIDQLTFTEVNNIVDGHVLGGADGLDKALNKFVIGAMEIEEMERYIDPGSLLIVGNRPKAHRLALQRGAGVLVTGGFDTTEDVQALADELNLPIISSSYDTFTVASMINRAIYDRLIKKKIMLVEDIAQDGSGPISMKSANTVQDWNELVKETGLSRFPVVDEWNRVVGIITSKDIVGASADQTIEKLMTRNPRVVQLQTSLASAAHKMVWEGIELLPVVDRNRKLIGAISRQDVLRTMQYVQQQPQTGETFEDLIWSTFEEASQANGELSFRGTILPQMASSIGNVSEGLLSTLMSKAAFRTINEHKKADLILDNASTYFIRPLQIESEIEIIPKMIELSRKFAKVEVEVIHHNTLIAKSLLTMQMIEQMQ